MVVTSYKGNAGSSKQPPENLNQVFGCLPVKSDSCHCKRPSMQTSDKAQDAVSMVELKNLARSVLPSSSALRGIILCEHDYLPREEVAIKVKVCSKLLYREMKVKS
jgi:hypothetical protein